MLALNLAMALWAFHKGFVAIATAFLIIAIINATQLR